MVKWINRRRASLWTLAAAALLLQGCEDKSSRGRRDRRAQEKRARALAALPYLSETPVADRDRAKVGVTRHDRQRAHPGINVYCAETEDEARLLDMDGNTVHRFALDALRGCKVLAPYQGRGFLALGDGNGLMLVDWDSTVKWHTEAWFHHDFDVAPDGSIYVLANTIGHLPVRGVVLPYTDDLIVELDREGRWVRARSVGQLLQDHITAAQRDRLYADFADDGRVELNAEKATDITHTNTIAVLDADLDVAPAGSILICSRYLNLIAIVDARLQRVLWSWGQGQLQGPHHPTLLPNKRLLIFDNGLQRGRSRLVELDPTKKTIVWEYNPGKSAFFSATRGSAQRLPGGNTLVAESDRGRLFEITRQREVVWEYWTPTTRGDDGKVMRQTVFRAWRWGEDSVDNPAYRKLWRRLFPRAGR